jgi:drug/metabolite transporter (DMT)-like permease
MTIQSSYRNAALFVLLAAIWGSAFTAIKIGLEYFPPVLYAALRYYLATLAMVGYMYLSTDRWRPRTVGEWLNIVASGVFIYAGYHAFLFVGQQYTTSTVAAIIVSIIPVLTVGFARALLPSERLTVVGLVGVGVSFGGVVLVIGPTLLEAVDLTSRGELLILGCAISYALGSVFTQRYQVTLPIVTRQAWAMGIGAGLLHLTSGALGESAGAIHWTPEAVSVLLYIVAGPSVVGFLLYFTLHERLGSIEANLIAYADPVFAAVFGWVLLGEEMSVLTAIGFLVIFLGFLLVKRDEFSEEIAKWRGSTA